jgi:threonine/homoserine/homoserine lactone efflux protein
MGSAIGEVLPFAIGVAISPIPIIGVILMLFSERARQNGPTFLAGWIIGLTAVTVVVLFVAAGAGADSGDTSTAVSWIKLGLGVLLIVLAFRQWQKRPRPGQPAQQPAWMAGIDSLQPSRAFLLGVLLSAVNPKNLTLSIGAALAISQTGADAVAATIAVIVFVLLGSIAIIVPVAYAIFGGDAATQTLDGWKTWLGDHNAAVMTVVLLVMGVVLVGKGIGPALG